MGTFEDNIRNKFNSAEVPMGTGAWDAFEHKLDGAQMSDLLFTQKVVNALEFSLVPYSPEHWKAMHQKLDLDVEGNFENKIRSKFSEAKFAGSVVGWEDMLSKLDVTNTGDFDKSAKEKFNEEEVEYNEEHWKEMEKILDKDKKPAFWAYLAIGALAIGATVMWGLSGDNLEVIAEDKISETAQDLGALLEVNKDVTTLSSEEFEKLGDEIGAANSNTEILSIEEAREKAAFDKLEREFRKNQLHLVLEGNSKRSKRSARNVGDKSKRKVGKSGELNANQGGSSASNMLTGSGTSSILSSVSNESTNEEEQFGMAEMIVENVALSEPYLDYQFTDVEFDKRKVRKAVLHSGLLPYLNFWDQVAATGMTGKNQASLFTSQDWKVFRRYGKQVDFQFNVPFQVLGGFEHRFDNSGFAIGTYLSNNCQNNWVYNAVNVSGSYEKSLNNSVLRFGVGLSYNRNHLLTEGLTLRDQVSVATSPINETNLDELKVPAESLIRTQFGVMLANEHFMFAFNVSDPLMVRINYNNDRSMKHEGLASGTISLSNAVKASGLIKVGYQESTYFSPAISVSKENSWFMLTEFEELNRYIFTLGYEFSQFRAYTSYGHVTKREVESSITDLFSQSGHVAVGVTYTRQ
ncbi:MAG: hypothetical protein ACJAZ2_000279 [Glaciecola sp.]|jgi:hypothetical protein